MAGYRKTATMSDTTMTEATYVELAKGSHMVVQLIENQVARLLWDELHGTDTASDTLDSLWDRGDYEWTLTEILATRLVRQASAQVLDKIERRLDDE